MAERWLPSGVRKPTSPWPAPTPDVRYSPGAAWSGFQSWLMQQGLQYCQQQQQQQANVQIVGDPELSLDSWDNLALTVYSSTGGVTVRFLGEYQMSNGRVQHFSRDIVPTSDRAANTAVVELPSSKLTTMTALLASGTAQRGQVYALAQRQRGRDSAATILGTAIAGYVTTSFSPSWPHSPQDDPLSGRGVLRSITGADPDAGAEATITVPTGARWLVHGGRVQFVTDGTVANRVCNLRIMDGATIVTSSHPEAVQAASTTRSYLWGPIPAPNASVASTIRAGFAQPQPMLAGWAWTTQTSNIAAGDNYGAPNLLVEEWLEP